MRAPDLMAVTRFGLGPRPGDVARAAADPVRYVRDQLRDPGAAVLSGPGLLDRPALLEQDHGYAVAVRAARRAARGESADDMEADRARLAQRERQKAVGEVHRVEVDARVAHGIATDAPYLERLVLFWSNHFAFDRTKSARLRLLAGSFERDVIRANVLGRFEDMLVASTTHPVMLVYLDNVKSVGPNSRMGRRRNAKAGVNENLARELLELHTVGAGGGYTQADVVALAETLSGWTGGMQRRDRGTPFEERLHEPGPRTILGVRYEALEEEQLLAVLPDLARHPATARHLAGKLARHFVGDDAPEGLVEDLAAVYLDTDGDLRAVATALAEHDLAWAGPPTKTVPPYDFVIGAGRAFGQEALPGPFVSGAARDLAHEVWKAPSPAGHPDHDRAFLGGDSLLERIDVASEMARRFGGGLDPRRLARDLFGDSLDPFLAEAIERAEDRRQGLVLLLMSPVFQRR